jgi:hypothetical protein
MNNKSYITIKTTQINTVDFSEVIEEKANLRYSLDSTEFVCKWREGSPYMPASITAVPSADRSDILNQEECLVVMASAEWADPNAMP